VHTDPAGTSAVVSSLDPASSPRRLPADQRKRQILNAAEEQFAATGYHSTNSAALAKAAGVSEANLYAHFGTKEKLFQDAVDHSTQQRLVVLRGSIASLRSLPPVGSIEGMAAATVLACVEEKGSLMAWALLEMPEFAADVHRAEIGATEALWISEIASRFGDSSAGEQLSIHVVPYAAHACLAFGLWLASLRHTPATAQAHARQYAGGIVHVARAALGALR
jgi:AcrR family transcriptional regulator